MMNVFLPRYVERMGNALQVDQKMKILLIFFSNKKKLIELVGKNYEMQFIVHLELVVILVAVVP